MDSNAFVVDREADKVFYWLMFSGYVMVATYIFGMPGLALIASATGW